MAARGKFNSENSRYLKELCNEVCLNSNSKNRHQIEWIITNATAQNIERRSINNKQTQKEAGMNKLEEDC